MSSIMECDLQNLLSSFNSLNTNNRDDLIHQFHSLTGQSINWKDCAYFLEMNNWNLQQAICLYYDVEKNDKSLPQMSFVEDVTVGHGTTVPPKTRLVKTWKIRNQGWETWPPGCSLRFTGNGDQMTHIERVALPSLKPGEMYDASVELESPDSGGIYQGQWRMCTPTGIYCGDTIWVILQVDENSLLSLTHQLSAIPLGQSNFDHSTSDAFAAAKIPFATSNSAAFPGNNSPTGESDSNVWTTTSDGTMEDDGWT